MRELLRAHRAIAFIVAAFIALASYYSVTTPLLETPDEREHFGFVQFVASGRGLPVQSVDQVVHFAKQEGSQPPLYYWVAAAATFWIDTSDFPALAWENPHYGYNVPGVVNDNKNLFIHTARESFPYTGAVLAVHLARFVSVLFGALAVVFTYLLALEFFARDKALAACAAVVAAFVPQFLFISGAVSNDSAIVACAALALWRMVRALHVPPNAREIFLIGVICGIAALAKVSGLILLGVAFLVIVLHAMPKFSIADFRFSSVAQSAIENRKSKILPSFLLFAFSFLLVSGWWYARNYFLYGEVTGTEMMLKIFGGRSEPITLDLFAAQMREVFETFWVGFGWGNVRAPEWVYGLLAAVSALGGLGLLKFLIFDWRFSIRDSWSLRAIRPKFEIRKPVLSEAKDPKSKILLLLFWLLLVLAALVRWMLVTQAPHGRLFFPALPALAALMVLGWTQILPDRLAEWKASVLPSNRASIFASFAPFASFAHVLTFASFALALFANLTILAPAYAFPAWLSETAAQNTPNRVEITYANQMKLIGYEIAPTRVTPGGSLQVTLYWQSLAPMNDDYSIGLNLLDTDQRVIASRASYPGHGLLPTRLWQPGQMLRDTYWMPAPAEVAAPTLAQLQVTLYSRADRRDLIAQDARGNAITPMVGRVRIAAPDNSQPAHATNYVFGNQISLIGYDLDAGKLVLYWQARTPLSTDYTVFVHWLNASGNVIAQRDQQPQNGNAPTALWESGEVIHDPYASDPAGARAVRIGLYRAETGERLVVVNGSGNSIGDSITVNLEGTR